LNGAARNNWARNFGSLVQTVCGETHSQEKKLDLMQSKAVWDFYEVFSKTTM